MIPPNAIIARIKQMQNSYSNSELYVAGKQGIMGTDKSMKGRTD